MARISTSSVLEAESTTKASQGRAPSRGPGRVVLPRQPGPRPPPSRLCPSSCGFSVRVCARAPVCEDTAGCTSTSSSAVTSSSLGHISKDPVSKWDPLWGPRLEPCTSFGGRSFTCTVTNRARVWLMESRPSKKEKMQCLPSVPVLSSLWDNPPGWPWRAC